jgi:hypothetical protein
MKRFPFFFLFSVLTVFAMIGVALFPLRPLAAVAKEAVAEGASLVFDAKALNSVQGLPGFPVTKAPGPRDDQAGPRLASFSVLGPNARHSKGARLVFGSQTRRVLADGPLTLRINLKALANNPAQAMAIGIVRGGAVDWQSARLDPTTNVLEFSIAQGSAPAQALAIWPAIEGLGHGIELQSIVFFRGHSRISQ